jgi:signal transduction histidine kinase
MFEAMNPVALGNATTFALTAVLMGVVLVRRPPARSVHAFLLLVLTAILIWSGGAVWRAIAPDHAQIMAAHHLVFLGVNLVPTSFLYLALAATRPGFLERRSVRKLAFAVPALLLYLGFATNEAHGLFARIHYQEFQRGVLFWATVAWAFACNLSGAVLFLQRSRALAGRSERRGALLLGLAAVIPLVVSSTYLFRWLPWPMDPTPGALGVSSALLYAVVLRLRALDDLPLLRRDVIDHLKDAVLIADPTGRVVDHNPAARALLAAPGAPHGRSLADLIGDLCAPPDAAPIRKLIAEGTTGTAELQTADGRSFRLQAVCVGGDGDTLAGRFAVLHDRTDERRADRALRQAQKLEGLGMLAAGIAHEVNNPLAFIRANLVHLSDGAGLVKQLADRVSPDEAALLEEMPLVLAESLEGIDRIASIVAGMRRVSRGGSDAREPLCANEVTLEALRLADLSHGRGSVEIERRLASPLPRTLGSRDGLIQVVLNLLLNAVQAIGERAAGRIRVTTCVESGSVCLRVEDDGPGIPEAILERIFDPFFTTRGPDQGMGLGLAIAFDLVREHRGTLEAGAGDLGGARFTVRLPVA